MTRDDLIDLLSDLQVSLIIAEQAVASLRLQIEKVDSAIIKSYIEGIDGEES